MTLKHDLIIEKKKKKKMAEMTVNGDYLKRNKINFDQQIDTFLLYSILLSTFDHSNKLVFW